MPDLGGFQFQQLGTDWQEESTPDFTTVVKHEMDTEDEDEKIKPEAQRPTTYNNSVPIKTNYKKTKSKKISAEDNENIQFRIKTDNAGNYFCNHQDCTYQGMSRSGLVRHIKTFHLSKNVGKEYKARNYIPKLSTKEEEIINASIKVSDDGKYNVCIAATNCAYKSVSKSGLVRHIKVVHLNLATYSCKLCSYTTRFSQTLTAHVASMHDKIKHTCQFCDYSSTHKASVYQHTRKTHGSGKNKKCTECDYKTYSNDLLNCHINGRHLKTLLHCDQCEFQTTWGGSLRNHIKNTHEKEQHSND